MFQLYDTDLFKVICEAVILTYIYYSQPLIPDRVHHIFVWTRFERREKPDQSLYAERYARKYLVPFTKPMLKMVWNWWKGKPSGSTACTRKQQPRFYWNCSSVVMNDATPLTPPSAWALSMKSHKPTNQTYMDSQWSASVQWDRHCCLRHTSWSRCWRSLVPSHHPARTFPAPCYWRRYTTHTRGWTCSLHMCAGPSI